MGGCNDFYLSRGRVAIQSSELVAIQRAEIGLRAAITKGCRQCCIYLTRAKATDTLDRYLE